MSPPKRMVEMDRWILQKLNGVIEKSNAAYNDYEFHIPTFAIHQFCVNELSSFYLDSSKDRMYADGTESISRKSSRTAMWVVLSSLTRMLAPDFELYCQGDLAGDAQYRQVGCLKAFSFPTGPKRSIFPAAGNLRRSGRRSPDVRSAISRVLENARTKNIIGHSLDARVEVERNSAPEAASAFAFDEDLRVFSIVSGFSWVDEISDLAVVQIDGETSVKVGSRQSREKCPRCWQYTEKGNEDGLCPRCASVTLK